MKCPQCEEETLVVETRDGTRRRRKCSNGHRFTTVEVPAAVVKAIGEGKFKAAAAANARGAFRRKMAEDVRAAVIARAGWKATAVAHDIGISEARVRQIRRSLETAPPPIP